MKNKNYFKKQVIFYCVEDLKQAENYLLLNGIMYEKWINNLRDTELRMYLSALNDEEYNKVKRKYKEITKNDYLIIFE